MGRKTWRIDGVLLIQHNLLRKFNYLYCPRPLLSAAVMDTFLAQVAAVAKQEGSLFLKIDPQARLELEHLHSRMDETHPLQPEQTMVVDLSKSEDELLAAMHEKTRYNIRLSERKEVEVTQVIRRDIKEDFEVFWNLLTQTATRNEFHLHDKTYYQLLSQVHTPYMSNELFFARMPHDHDSILAVAMINFHHDPAAGVSTATYLHGASSDEHREFMASHLLHWRIMQEAKRRGIGSYDLWGIDEQRWSGITRFKIGFGGVAVTYPVSTNIIYRPVWNMLYTFMKNRKQHFPHVVKISHE